MKKLLGFILCVMLIASLSSLVFSSTRSIPFTDVPEGEWYTDAVVTAYENNIIKGKSDTIFAPFDNLTRAEIVTILSRLSSDSTEGCADSLAFTDTPKDEWYSDPIGWAVEKGIVKGYEDNTFRPDDKVLRQELAVFFARYFDSEYMEFSEVDSPVVFKDESEFPDWAVDGINQMRITGIVRGDTAGYFNPADNATRAESAVMITRYFDALENVKDPMHAKLANITKLVECEKNMVVVNLDMYERLTDNGHKNSLSEQLLPQMGLDTDTYEIVADKDSLTEVRDTSTHGILAGEEEKGASYIRNIKICIRNSDTGEATETKAVRFNIKRNITVPIEAEEFDSGIDRDVYETMIDTSFATSGNIARFAKVFEKAAKGESITVGHIGGSITQGAVSGHSRQHSWSRISYEWLTKQYPDAEFTFVNAGIGGTPSDYGNFRAQPHLLSHDPDIVFIEFSVNDNAYSQVHRESYEALLRAALNDEKAPAVALVISVLATDKAVDQAMEYAEYYGVPVINANEGVYYGINKGEFTLSEYAPDGVHPYEWGHRIMADMAINFYKQMIILASDAADEDLAEIPVPEATVSGCYFGDLVYCDGESFNEIELGGWRVTDVVDNGDLLDKHANLYRGKKAWEGSAGDTMSFVVEAKSITLLVGGGSISVTVNGQTATYYGLSQYCTIVAGEDNAELNVEIRANSDTVIFGFAYN